MIRAKLVESRLQFAFRARKGPGQSYVPMSAAVHTSEVLKRRSREKRAS